MIEVAIGAARYRVSARTAALLGMLAQLDPELERHPIGSVTLHYAHGKLWPVVAASHPPVTLPDGVMRSEARR